MTADMADESLPRHRSADLFLRPGVRPWPAALNAEISQSDRGGRPVHWSASRRCITRTQAPPAPMAEHLQPGGTARGARARAQSLSRGSASRPRRHDRCDVIGKTREQIRSLHFRRDRDWLQS